ncbi:MAG TPA: glycoside hydrolase family 43 protein [Verrucomicrobiae bacterium]|nr:glycoside hydrolase family 43 protein [Verrucomicrobiae bacterium]
MKTICLLLAFLAVEVFAADSGFLFVTFKGEQSPMTEQVYFASSRDGRNWNALNGGEPVLVSALGEKGVRDPYLLRSHDGHRFYLIATDLSINLNRNWKRAVEAGSRSIVIWESTNLVQWSEPRLVRVAAEDAGCTWAPEAIYDEEARDYLVFWASTTRRDEFRKHRIWAARTKDFQTFGEPFVYIEKAATVIDTTIVRSGTNYVRFTKDEQSKGIIMEASEKLMGPWRDVPDFSLKDLRGYEGPECYLVEPASEGKPPTWCLILDHYSRGRGYQPYVTHDLAGGQFNAGEGFTFPFRFRHGSVLPISSAELARVEKAYARP